MYEVSVEQHFDAAHYLRDYQGKCESLHGHRYQVVAKVKTWRPCFSFPCGSMGISR